MTEIVSNDGATQAVVPDTAAQTISPTTTTSGAAAVPQPSAATSVAQGAPDSANLAPATCTTVPAELLTQVQDELATALQPAPQVPPSTAPTPAAVSVPPTAAPTDGESLELLRKIDTNVSALSERLANVEKVAIRNGALAGGVAGALSGGIIATGIAFAKAKLGF